MFLSEKYEQLEAIGNQHEELKVKPVKGELKQVSEFMHLGGLKT